MRWKKKQFNAFQRISSKIHRIFYKSSLHLFSKVYWIYFKSQNIIEVRDAQRRGIRRCSHAVSEQFQPLSGSLVFVRIPLNAVKINNSPLFTAFTAKRCKKYAAKINVFHRISPHFLRKLNTKPGPGYLYNLIELKQIFRQRFAPITFEFLPSEKFSTTLNLVWLFVGFYSFR